MTLWSLLRARQHYDLLKLVLDESGYSEMLKNKKDLENENRLENLKELLRAMRDYDSLQNFLEHVSLATSIDQEWEGAKVNLMTMHAAKGLEFNVVFLPGWEEGLFPHQKSLEEKGDFALEEEREKVPSCQAPQQGEKSWMLEGIEARTRKLSFFWEFCGRTSPSETPKRPRWEVSL